MTELEVNCIQRPSPQAAHHQITHLGHRGFACQMPVELAILQIRGRLHLFYMVEPATQIKIYLDVRREPGRCPYLQAQVDGVWTEHLLALPDCRPSFRVIKDGLDIESRQAVRFLMQR